VVAEENKAVSVIFSSSSVDDSRRLFSSVSRERDENADQPVSASCVSNGVAVGKNYHTLRGLGLDTSAPNFASVP